MSYTELLLDVEDGVATLTFNRPDARNALGGAMREEFGQAVAEIAPRAGQDIHAVILTGAGKAFCAGGDLRALQTLAKDGPDAIRQRMRDGHAMLKPWMDLPVPTIAAVNGAAAGAGFSLAIACDFVVAARSARFVMSFGRVGLVPDWGALYTLPRLVGMQRAKDLIFTARSLDAEEAEALGIAIEVVPDADLPARAKAFARRFRNASPTAIRAAKAVFAGSFERALDAVLEAEADAQAIAGASDYHHRAVERFLAKEPALFDWDRDGD